MKANPHSHSLNLEYEQIFKLHLLLELVVMLLKLCLSCSQETESSLEIMRKGKFLLLSEPVNGEQLGEKF